MGTSMKYVDSSIMNTEIYMLLTGKNAEELTHYDMKKIQDYMVLSDELTDEILFK